MGFGNLKSAAGLKTLNEFLADKSFIEGYTVSQADVVVFQALNGAPSADLFHALRWYNQTKSYNSSFDSLPGVKKPLTQYGGKAAPAADDSDSDSEDDDLFGGEKDTEALAKVKAKMAEANKKPKKVLIAKSNIVFDVKPWEDTTNMEEIEAFVRGIEMDGLLWGAGQLVPLAYGVKKLQIACVIEDDKVSSDDLQEKIESFESHVQSTDIAAFNKV